MRIAFVNTLYPPHGSSGAEVTLRFLARRLSARGHACTIVTLTPEREGCVGEIDGIPVCYLPLANVYWPHGGRRPALLRPVFQALDAFNPVMQRRIAAVLGRFRPDVVNAHNLQGFSVSAWSAAARLGIPLVQTLHDYYTVCPRSAMWRPGRGNCARQCPECRLFSTPRRRLSGLPAAVTCVSRRVFDRITATGMFAAAKAGRQPVRIIRGNNPDEELPTLPPARRGGPWRFGSMSRLDPAKGLENLIDAMAGLPPGSATLAIAGNGRDEYASLLRARAAGIPGIEFLGHVTPTSFFDKIDTLVIPSIWEDPFPRVFHEAMAYGVPSIVTPLGGLPEAIDHGRTGIIAEGADVASLRNAMRQVVDGVWKQEDLRCACRAAAVAYQPARIVSQYESVLSAVIDGGAMENAGEAWHPTPSY
jgi:glycosyltransferase involved in cell wall biosynthesis